MHIPVLMEDRIVITSEISKEYTNGLGVKLKLCCLENLQGKGEPKKSTTHTMVLGMDLKSRMSSA
jgi:hypothetical protein